MPASSTARAEPAPSRAGIGAAARRWRSWACGATSTSRCTCRCATRTRRALVPHRRRARRRERRRSKASCAMRGSSSGRAGSWSCTLGRRQRRAGAALPALLPVAPEDAARPARGCACAARRAAASSACEMVHPSVQGRRRRHAAADLADAGLPEQRAAAAGLPAQGDRRRRWRARRWTSAAGRRACRPACRRLREALALPAPPAARREPRRARGPLPSGLAAAEVRGAAGAAALAAAGAARARSAARAGAARRAAAACTSSCSPRCRSR